MSKKLYLDLPKELSEKDRDEILNEIRNIDGVEKSKLDQERFLDPVSITAYIALATAAIAVVDKAIPIVQKIVQLFKKKGLTTVNVTLPDGTKMSIEEGNANDVEKLALALTKIGKKED